MLRRSIPITWFVLCWSLAFHYESLRANYLTPLFKRDLPKLALLFPPAGWIMFFDVPDRYGFAEVYSVHNAEPELIDPHRVFETRAVGYDNIRRNMLVTVADQRRGPAFCRYLRRKFPSYESFAVVIAEYPDLTPRQDPPPHQVMYRCE